MARITINLDDQTEQLARAAAEASGVPFEEWVAQVILERTAMTWPREVLDLAGTWPDFPLAEEIRRQQKRDAPRDH